MEAGNYKARINMYGISLTKEEKPQIAVNFVISSTGEKITYFGSLSEKAQDRTLKVLISLGFPPGASIAQLAMGVQSALLPLGQEHEISVTKEFYNGKDVFKCNVVLDDDGGIINAVPVDRAFAILGGLNLDTKLQSLRKPTTGIQQTNDVPF